MDKQRKPRTRHSYREPIREAIRQRLARGETLHIRSIIKEACGGSISTVRQELAKMLGEDKIKASTLIGAGASSVTARVGALEQAIDASLERERILEAKNSALQESLDTSREELARLLTDHHDSQKLLFQTVDDLRQMIKAGRSSLPAGILEAERAKTGKSEMNGDVIYWRAKYDQLLQQFIDLNGKNRILGSRLHDLGGDLD